MKKLTHIVYYKQRSLQRSLLTRNSSNSRLMSLKYFYKIYRSMRVPPWFILVSPWGVPQLQSDWSLSCDHGLDYGSYCENNNNDTWHMAGTHDRWCSCSFEHMYTWGWRKFLTHTGKRGAGWRKLTWLPRCNVSTTAGVISCTVGTVVQISLSLGVIGTTTGLFSLFRRCCFLHHSTFAGATETHKEVVFVSVVVVVLFIVVIVIFYVSVSGQQAVVTGVVSLPRPWNHI